MKKATVRKTRAISDPLVKYVSFTKLLAPRNAGHDGARGDVLASDGLPPGHQQRLTALSHEHGPASSLFHGPQARSAKFIISYLEELKKIKLLFRLTGGRSDNSSSSLGPHPAR